MEDIKKYIRTRNASNLNRFVTNSTANSIAFYAMAYLNGQNYSPEVIKRMREQFSLKNLDGGEFRIDELLESFSAQSAYFLNLYAYMNENDRFLKYAEDLVNKDHFRFVFKSYTDYASLRLHYQRKVFHTHLSCKNMKSDFESEEKYYRNSGVFGRKEERKLKYYSLPEPYLLKLGMRQCNNCYNLEIQEIPFEEILKLDAQVFNSPSKKKESSRV